MQGGHAPQVPHFNFTVTQLEYCISYCMENTELFFFLTYFHVTSWVTGKKK